MTPEMPSPAPSPMPSAPPPGPSDASNKLTLDPNLMSKAKGENQCKAGDTFKITATARYNDTGGFDVVDVEPMLLVDGVTGPAEDSTTLSDDEEERVLGFKRPKKNMAGPVTL